MKILKTVAELTEYINAYLATKYVSTSKKISTNGDLWWFVAVCEARMNADSNTTKDWAHMFMEGITPMSDQKVEEWLATFFEDIEHAEQEGEQLDHEAYTEVYEQINSAIDAHFGLD